VCFIPDWRPISTAASLILTNQWFHWGNWRALDWRIECGTGKMEVERGREKTNEKKQKEGIAYKNSQAEHLALKKTTMLNKEHRKRKL